MAREPIRISLLGLGRAGTFHLQSLRAMDSAVIACVFDVDQAKSNAVAGQHECDSAESAADAIDRSDIDAVIVATPTDMHFEFVQQSLEAGKPTLTEKPLGRHLWEVDACFETALANDTPLFVAFQRRFDPSFSSLVRAVKAGDVGQLQFVRSVSRDNPVPATDYIRISGGIFHDCMVHDLDMVTHIVAETPTHISSFGSSFIGPIGELGDFDNVVTTLSFPSGVHASIDINRKSVFGYDQRIEVFGDGGMLQAENRHNTTVVRANENGFVRPTVDFSFPTRYREAYQWELECFVRCARGEEDVPITHQDVRLNHLLATGAEMAVREKRVVLFEEIDSSAEGRGD